MVDYRPQIEIADKMADLVDRFLREKANLTELTTVLLEYRAAQMLTDKRLREAFEELQKNLKPQLDFEEKTLYRRLQVEGKPETEN